MFSRDITSAHWRQLKNYQSHHPVLWDQTNPLPSFYFSLCPLHPPAPSFPSVNPPHSYHCGTVNPPPLLLLPSQSPSGGTREAKRREHICHLPATHNTEQAINFGLTCICSSLGHTHTHTQHLVPPSTPPQQGLLGNWGVRVGGWFEGGLGG